MGDALDDFIADRERTDPEPFNEPTKRGLMPPTTATTTPPAAGPAKPTAGPVSAPAGGPPRAPSRPATASPAAPARATAAKISRVIAKAEPPRLVLNGIEGFGKTSLVAFAPEPLILMARGETGYRTLVNQGRAPEHDAALIDEWGSLIATLTELGAAATIPYQTIALDAMGGFERLCHEFVCARDFKNDWGEKGFGAFQKGYDVSVTEWLQLLQALDKLHGRGCAIVLLSHCKIRSFKNPLGADFDRYVSDVHDKTWGVTAKWADAVLFGNFAAIVDKEKQGKGKGIGGTDRVLYAERRDAFDAKNRYGMPEQLDVPNDPSALWSTLAPYFTAPTTNPA